ncbi:MAG TPA: TAT-variant-translocated molybdopterin oxidoreductase [Vicinamibacteria bacterium]|nr:TAT-variant-translocated molybdopterin oxidoreductase [Vicinamibacteria bacterium]
MSEHEIPAVPVSLEGVRRRAGGQDTPRRRFWKSLDELADTPAFLEFLHREFPEQASVFEDPKGRRDFLTLMGASLALAGLTACTKQPEERILPYVRQPEGVVPGRPLFFASAYGPDGYARGILVESHEGRPTKVEGNPDHPISLGATDVWGQAHVLGVYDPDRSKSVLYVGEDRTWSDFRAAVHELLERQRPGRGAGLRLLTPRVTSPALAAQVQSVLAALPLARWVAWQPDSRDNARAGAEMAFGEKVEPQYRFDQADVVLSLESDFTFSHPAALRQQRQFSSRRMVDPEKPEMNRLYVVEGMPTPTGSVADHRLALRSSQIEGFARAVAKAVGLPVEGGFDHPWVGPIASDLRRAGARALVIAGETQPAAVHAIAHALNQALGAAGTTVVYTPPAEASAAGELAALRELVAEMRAGKVEALVIVGGNPVYEAPADLGFASALDQVKLRIHHGLYLDETAERCHWHLPASHPLESWGDLRAVEGTVSLVQPLIAPLYNTLSELELLATLAENPETKGYDVLRSFWQGQPGEGDFQKRWNRALHDGVLAGTASAERPVQAARGGDWARAPQRAASGGIDLQFRLDPTVYDGRFANLGWLQELPKPLSKITWDNAAFMSPSTAKRLGGFQTEERGAGHWTDVVELRYRGRAVRAPVWILPGHPDDAVTIHLGLGRRRAGRVGTGVGFDAYALQTADAPWFGEGLEVRRTGQRMMIACTQDHWTIENAEGAQAQARHVVQPLTLAELAKDPDALRRQGEAETEPGLSLYPAYRYDGLKWGMSIDMSACVGCNACVIACQAENNIPVVGKEQVGRGREMHWIRVDRYYQGPPEAPEVYLQPLPCQQCEKAPCEVVCPVGATVHSEEGLNDMVYNRCVGTRYCSNNCPYKVRRFNFLLYQDWTTPTFKMMRNPEVTVRSRGVMEKCTYCVQRIERSRIDAKNQGRPLRDGDIVPACAQACPSRAIVFGDLNDQASQVARRHRSRRRYALLTELQTQPRTTYLAPVRNRNPQIPGPGGPEAHRG